MRTTLTLDADVAVQVEQVRRRRGVSLKEAINDALRRGLQDLADGEMPRREFSTATFDMGGSRLPTLDNIAEALAVAEGETFR